MKDRYIYPAIFHYEGNLIGVTFPDLPGCVSCGDTETEALEMAGEALGLHLYGMERDEDTIPTPTALRDVAVGPDDCAVFVEAWMPPIRWELRNKVVKKTLTIPRWLNDIAEKHDVNFSHMLQDALKHHLGVKDPGM